MYEFEPASPIYAISDTIVEHRLHGQLEAALAAPSPTGPARICTARISAHAPTPVTARLLDTVTRYAPPCPTPARPPLETVAHLLTTGAVFQRPDKSGLFVRFGHAEAWLDDRRLVVTLGSPGGGLSLVLGGPWDASSTTAAALRELTEAQQLAGQVTALLPPGPWQVLSDRWPPDAASSCPQPAAWTRKTRSAAASPGHCARFNTTWARHSRTGTSRS
jgi:hypothetical protein